MTILDAIILGVVEGITEYLPVSSTGHLILASAFLGLDDPESKASVDAFNIVIQGGAILAVLGLYFGRVMQMVRGMLGKDRDGLRLAVNIIVAFLPAAVLGVLFDDIIEAHLFHAWPVLAALFVGGLFMIWIDRTRLKGHRLEAEAHDRAFIELHEMTPMKALFIGFLQCVAMWPGTSRSMMTISGGVLVGLRPKEAAEFSFLLGLPTLGGACVYKLLKNVTSDEGPNMFEVIGWMPIVVGIVVATIAAALAVRWLVGFLNRHGLAPFGWYRIALTLVLGGLVLADIVRI